ncbi:phospholipase B-like 1 [Oscarella lobularis]|uniref:phospholipase B-like 1 n=1 Tax=Oscarella lobularis TaxID=121494 RepID=UPI00331415FD
MIVLFLLSSVVKAASAEPIRATVLYDSLGHPTLKLNVIDKSGAAYGLFSDEIETTGWGQLQITAGYGSNKIYSDTQLMFAAGYLESALTAKRIYQHFHNTMPQILPDSGMAAKVRVWFQEQEKWMTQMIDMNKEDSYWRQVGLVYAQYRGLVQGYKEHSSSTEELEDFSFQVLNGYGDLLDIPAAINRSLAPNWNKMTLSEIRDAVAARSHCSVLVKMLPGFEDIVFGHTTWFSFSIMLRIYKHYDLNLQDPATASKGVSFSSYPGCLVSLDDFYIMSSGIIMLQTTNNMWNHSLYDLVKPQSLLAWHRVKVANTMASTSQMWAEIVAKYNSGTYTNQYMLLDLKRFKAKMSLEDGALWVAEQIPGLTVAQDLTRMLREGHWASYNVPFYEKIYNMSGYVDFVESHGVEFSHELAPRAKIFRRDSDKVAGVESLKSLLRYNNYKNEPYSGGNACNTICCRGDMLNPAKAFGCFDTKVANYSMGISRIAEGVSSPTINGGLSPFSWSEFPNVSHLGMPTEWNFDFVHMEPIELD